MSPRKTWLCGSYFITYSGIDIDPLNPQDQPFILPPDPEPVLNARVYPYTLEESSWLMTNDGDIIDTQDGDDIVTPIPNPVGTADTAALAATLDADGLSVTTIYLDLFDGSPASPMTGRSVLQAITGSSTRTNIGGSLATTNETATNTVVITISTGSASVTNVNWIAFYNAASGGTLLMYAPVAVASNGGGVGVGTVVQINQLDLNFTEVGGGVDMASESGVPMISQDSQYMITE